MPVFDDLHDEAWQPVTPTSPPWNGVPVLVWKDGDSVWISGRKRTPYAGMNHDWYLGSHRFPPTHWMSLPKPPVDNPVDKSA